MGASAALGPRHQRVERLRRLLRRRSLRASDRAFVLEGATLLAEALAGGVAVEAVFVAPGGAGSPGGAEVLARAHDAGVRIYELEPGVLERVAGTVTPQPIIAVARWCDVSLADVEAAGLVVVCVDVRDPGNAGTVVRSAEAAGVGAVVFCDGSVDPFNPKCVRASAGSLFHVPVALGGPPDDVFDALAGWGYRRLGTGPRGGTDHTEADLTGRVALVLGNEAHGLDADLAARLDGILTIPLAGRSESLNVGMAAAVLCFEALRQRRMTAGAVDPAAYHQPPPDQEPSTR